MRLLKDGLGNAFELQSPPRRIVSLVPSQTELLHDLGLEEEVVGITKFCIHPQKWFKNKSRVGGTKTVHIDKVKSLQPDLIIANKEENVQEQIAALQAIAPVWVTDINTVQDALRMISEIGLLCGKTSQAKLLVDDITSDFSQLPIGNVKGRSVAYCIWYAPWMVAGSHNFIHDVLEKIGFENVFSNVERYPEVDLATLEATQPDYVLLSSEPFPFSEKHVEEVKKVLPNATVLLVDGEPFSWYGSRLCHALTYFTKVFG